MSTYGVIEITVIFLELLLVIDRIIAVAVMRYNNENEGMVEMLSILPEYQKKGLSSRLLRHCEYVFHRGGFRSMKMQILYEKNKSYEYLERLGYTVIADEEITEMKNSIKHEVYNKYRKLTITKDISILYLCLLIDLFKN